jgi:hypothetical protein
MGATDKPPALPAVARSGRFRTGGPVVVVVVVVAVDEADRVDELETVRAGEKCAIADPGRAGRFFAANAAFLWATTASRRLGFPGPSVLLDIPRPGRAAVTSGLFGEFGLFGSFCNSFWAVASRLIMILHPN